MDAGERGVMAKKYDIEGYRKALMSIADPKKLGKSVMTPLRKGQRDLGRYLKWHYWQHSLGSKVWIWRNKQPWGKKYKGAGPVVRTRKRQRTRWSASQQAYIAPIFVSGLAAKIEMGGQRLRKHVMWGRDSDVRKGVMVSRKPAMDRVIAREWPKIVINIEQSYRKFIERTL
jgi:hypothetical protein